VTVDLRLGDCLDIMRMLPDGCVDAVITDPPYGEKQASWDDSKPPEVIWDDLYRVLKYGGVLYYWGFWGHAPWVLGNAKRVGFTPLSRIVWWFRTGRPEKLSYREDTEEAWYLAKGTPTTFNAHVALEPYVDQNNYKRYGRDGKHPGTVWIASRIFHNHPENCNHPTQKPLDLIRKMVEISTNLGDTVLDPFAGSGTTGVACVQTGRNFIGCEISEEYFAIAEKRIAEAQMQLRLAV
jgi:DNA modification methylase